MVFLSFHLLSIEERRNDSDSFIFTLKNPHNIEPTQYRPVANNTNSTITCDSNCGPIFGVTRNQRRRGYYSTYYCDIYIDNDCNKPNRCYTWNNGNGVYTYDSSYVGSLYVNTGSSSEQNYFTVLDYEVYYIDYKGKNTVYHLCNYPDAVWYYIQNNDITKDQLKDVDEEQDLLHDLDVIHNEDQSIRYKILRYLRDPSSFLPDTHIVSTQYDSILKEWIGDNTMKLAYRASDHGYSGSSFHQYCDDLNSPTLIVIKSDKGWIFGGYTSQSWKLTNMDAYGIFFF